MIDENIPHVIYHYTSLSTLNAILENKTIRLSDITKSNDSKEITWIVDFIPKTFERSYDTGTTAYLQKVIDKRQWMSVVSQKVNKWFDFGENDYSYYVCCFSKDRDLLSQWRGYADDGRGVSIGFDTSALSKIIFFLMGDLLDIRKVIYEKRQQQKQIRAIADALLNKVKSHTKTITNMSTHDAYLYLDEEAEKTFKELYKMAIVMKNPFFKEENEIRLCYLVNNKTVINSKALHPDPYVAGSTLHLDTVDYALQLNEFAELMPFQFFVKGNGLSSITIIK